MWILRIFTFQAKPNSNLRSVPSDLLEYVLIITMVWRDHDAWIDKSLTLNKKTGSYSFNILRFPNLEFCALKMISAVRLATLKNYEKSLRALIHLRLPRKYAQNIVLQFSDISCLYVMKYYNKNDVASHLGDWSLLNYILMQYRTENVINAKRE